MRRSRSLILVLAVGLAAAVGAVSPGTSVQPAAAALAAPAAAAAPATPILLSAANATGPGVAVAEDGAAHIAWLEEDAESDDHVVYCRLPRGATACDVRTDFDSLGFAAFGPVDVVLRDDGTIQVLAFFADNQEGSWLYESTDDGASFSEPRQIGTIATGHTVVGPGLNTVMAAYSGSAGPPGAGVQVQPTDGGFATAYAYLRDGDSRYYTGGAALIDDLTPISAYTDLENTYVRRFDSTQDADYNNEDKWLPSVALPDEDEPTIVSGANGAYLMTHVEYDGSAIKDAYQVRAISAEGVLGQPFLATEIGPAIFGTLHADTAGGLTAVWTQSGDGVPIMGSYSSGGGSFTPPGTLVANVRAYNLRVATAGDGGGAVVWDEQSSGRVSVAPIPAGGVVPDPDQPPPVPPPHVGGFTPPNNTPKCQRTVTIKPGVVAAAQGGPCWEQIGSSSRWTTKSDVNINGIKFVGGKSSTSVTVDTATHKVTATAGVVQKAGPVILAKDAGTWDIDGTTTFTNLEQFKIKLFDFRALGEASVTFKSGGADVAVNLEMPKPFDVVSGRTVLSTNMKQGLDLTKIQIRVPQLTIGEFGLRNLLVSYDRSSSTFNGEVELKLPPAGAYAEVKIGFKSGQLVKLSLVYKDGPSFPFPFTIYPGLWVNGVGFLYDGTDGFAIGGGADFAVPTPAGPITIDAIGSPPGTGGGFRFAIPKTGPASLDLQGTMGIYGFDLVNTRAHFDTSGLFNFKTSVDIGYPRLGVHGSVGGEVNLDDGTFYAEAEIDLCVVFCVGGKGVISDIGIAICGDIEFGVDPFSFEIGFLVGYKWQGGLEVGTTCDTGPYKTPASGSGPSPSGVVLASDGTLFIPGASDGATSYAVDIPGVGGVPNVVVRDLDGAVVVQTDPLNPAEPQQGENVVLVPSPSTDSARLVIIQDSSLPAGYKISSSGGTPLRMRTTRGAGGMRADAPAMTVAESYDPTAVAAQVGGTGRQRTVRYNATNLGESGREVVFVETSAAGINHEIGRSSAASGTFGFTVFDGAAGQRSIEAVVVNSEGLPISSTTIATFTAPGYVLPSKPTKLRLVLDKRSRLVVTWKGTGATRYVVYATVADGRRLQLVTSGKKVVIPGVSRRERVTVKVYGINGRGREGPSVSARRP